MAKQIRAASTVVLLRDGANGIEVFLLRRNPNLGGSHFGEALVFPGGVVDTEDADTQWTVFCDDLEFMQPRTLTGAGNSVLSFWIAGIRECFEEAGFLFARRRDGKWPTQPNLENWRKLLESDGLSFRDLVRREDLRLVTKKLYYYSHWVTPSGRPQRFDTRFFLAQAPRGQRGRHDGFETLGSGWLNAAEALVQYKEKKIVLWPPTQYTLLAITEFQRVQEMLDVTGRRALATVPGILPNLVQENGKTRVVFPWDDT